MIEGKNSKKFEKTIIKELQPFAELMALKQNFDVF
jgi:hypothetical protein